MRANCGNLRKPLIVLHKHPLKYTRRYLALIEVNNKIMIEEELLVIVNRQRNGKAAGVDGIKAEVMKHIIKNKRTSTKII